MATVTASSPEEKRNGPPDRRGSRLVGVLTLLPGPLPGTVYSLKQPMSVHLQMDLGGRYVISDATTGAFTSSDDQLGALTGFVGALVEEFEFLLSHESSLSPAMMSELERFRTLMERIPYSHALP
jgi:hypothetical protein